MMKAVTVSTSMLFNLLQDEPKLLVLDTRTKSAYSKGHIRRSHCVTLSPSGRKLQEVSGPGPPAWSSGCWWDRPIVIIIDREVHSGQPDEEDSSPHGSSYKRRKLDAELTEHPVVDFLLKENLARSVRVLQPGENSRNGFESFADAYPFLTTKQTKGPAISQYPNEIIPGLLYLGDWEHAKRESRLEDLGITHILTAHTESLETKGDYKQLFCDLSDEDQADITQHFCEAVEFVETARREDGRALVHCGAGASRSATLAAAYLMNTRRWSAQEALSFLKQCRTRVDPNPGFLQRLDEYEKTLASGSGESQGVPRLSQRSRTSAPPPRKPVIAPSLADAEGMHLEVLKDGEQVGVILLTGREEHEVGRGATCHIVLDHASISRQVDGQHATIKRRGEAAPELIDLGATHGTFVDGKRLMKGKPQILNEGDAIQFGASTRKYILHLGGTPASKSKWDGEADI